ILPSLNSSATAKWAINSLARGIDSNGAASVPTHSSNTTPQCPLSRALSNTSARPRVLRPPDGPRVTIKVIRLASTDRHVLTSSFGILSLAEPGDGDVACEEGISGQVLLEQRDA